MRSTPTVAKIEFTFGGVNWLPPTPKMAFLGRFGGNRPFVWAERQDGNNRTTTYSREMVVKLQVVPLLPPRSALV